MQRSIIDEFDRLLRTSSVRPAGRFLVASRDLCSDDHGVAVFVTK